jgi:hypothetical protein
MLTTRKDITYKAEHRLDSNGKSPISTPNSKAQVAVTPINRPLNNDVVYLRLNMGKGFIILSTFLM